MMSAQPRASRASRARLILTSGFAVFSMFFGSGNLVFPVMLGQAAGQGYGFAALGLLISGVLIPGLGLIGILLYKGSVQNFFQTLDARAAFLIPLIMLCLLGPFGVIPRCISVSFGSFDALFPGQSYILFSFLFCSATYLLLRADHKMIDIMGGILTPVLLIALGVIIWSALTHAPALQAVYTLPQIAHGVRQGYQMMDLLASFFFAATIMQHLQQRQPGNHYGVTLAAIGIGGGILAVIYFFLVYLGALYARALAGVAPEQSIAHIARLTLGWGSSCIVATTVIIACLTTAMALAKVCIRFTQTRLLKGRVHPQTVTFVILCLTFVVSLLKFDGIARVLGPILEILYPGLILLTFLNIIHYFKPLKHIPVIVYLSFIVSALWSMFPLI